MEEALTRNLMDMARSYGACAVGVATTGTLAWGPPSADLTYVLPEAGSAVSFAVALDQDLIEPWFAKTAHRPHFENNIRANVLASGISLELASYLRQKGHLSVPLAANNAYRDETPNGRFDEKPLLSHRYLAVRPGMGFFGLSGNVLTSAAGAAVILGSVVTAAKLVPSEPIPAAENYCDECRLCSAVCASGFFDEKEKVTVTLGGVAFSYSRRRHHNRCDGPDRGFACPELHVQISGRRASANSLLAAGTWVGPFT